MFSVKTYNALVKFNGTLKYHKLWLSSPLIGMLDSTAYTISTIQFYFSSSVPHFSAILNTNILQIKNIGE